MKLCRNNTIGSNWIDLRCSSQYVLTSFPPPQNATDSLVQATVNIDGLLDKASHRFNLIVPFWIFIWEMHIDLHIEEYVIYIGNISSTVVDLVLNLVHHDHIHFINSHCRLVWRLWIITQPITYQPQRLVSTLDWQEIKYASMDFMLIVLVWKSLLQ